MRSPQQTITGLLAHSLSHAQDSIARAEIQLKRMPFDHDTRSALETYKIWEQETKDAIEYMRMRP